MSSVHASKLERPLPPLAAAETPTFRLAVRTPELYPTLFQSIRAALGNGRWIRKSRRQADVAEVGRATGARV